MSGARMAKLTLLAVLVALLAYVAWNWSAWRAAGAASSAYAARITCSCRYVDGRSAGSCKEDVSEFGGLATISEDAGEKAITASIPLLGRAKARFRPGYGCLMEP
ncbi:MAG: hypothetical protein AB7U35_06350 [Sphingobium sp.]